VEQTSFNPPVADLEALRKKALMVAGAGLVVCAIGFVVDRDQFFRSWLIAFLLFLGITLGSMALMMIQHLSGGTWGVFRRVFEASARTLPLMAALFIPVIAGMTYLYPWTHDDLVKGDEIMRHKALYLNTGFFLARAFVYFAGWTAIAWTLTAWSKKQDEGDMTVNLPIQRLSGFGIKKKGRGSHPGLLCSAVPHLRRADCPRPISSRLPRKRARCPPCRRRARRCPSLHNKAGSVRCRRDRPAAARAPSRHCRPGGA